MARTSRGAGLPGALVLVFALGVAAFTAPASGVPDSTAIAAASQDPPLDPWSGRWSITEVTRDGQRILVRRNATAAAFAGGPRFRERLSVTVPLPRGADHTPAAEINRVETLLVEALERDRKALSVLVLTTDTAREFVFYSGDAASVSEVVSRVREQAAPYELHVQIAADPAWERYLAFAP